MNVGKTRAAIVGEPNFILFACEVPVFLDNSKFKTWEFGDQILGA